MEPDPIIDKSPAQKQLRLDKLRAELLDFGYSVVLSEWLSVALDRLKIHEIENVASSASTKGTTVIKHKD